MNLLEKWRRWTARRRTRAAKALMESSPLREFIYLDEVSIQSLLVSQKSTILENVSEGVSRAVESEVSSSLAASAIVGKGDVASRYQTSNSANAQTSRRAIVQSLFKEFRELPLDLKLSSTSSASDSVAASDALDDPHLSSRAATIERGSLVEIKVSLGVDPVYRLAAMMSEYGAMAETWPAMFSQPGLVGRLQESQPVMRILERFLAGLIPIKARATDLVVLERDGHDYVVQREALTDDQRAQSIPLDIVGVTEQLSYWKDLRRVLYSEGEYVMLCRVARSGVHESWTPVKLADLFSGLVPGLVESINAIRQPTPVDTAATSPPLADSPMQIALQHYYDLLVAQVEGAERNSATLALISGLANCANPSSSTEQRAAFDALREHVRSTTPEFAISGPRDLELRSTARSVAGLHLFPNSESSPVVGDTTTSARAEERLLDVEVIAIYW